MSQCERLRHLFISGLGDGEGAPENTQGARDLAPLPLVCPREGALSFYALALHSIASGILSEGPNPGDKHLSPYLRP